MWNMWYMIMIMVWLWYDYGMIMAWLWYDIQCEIWCEMMWAICIMRLYDECEQWRDVCEQWYDMCDLWCDEHWDEISIGWLCDNYDDMICAIGWYHMCDLWCDENEHWDEILIGRSWVMMPWMWAMMIWYMQLDDHDDYDDIICAIYDVTRMSIETRYWLDDLVCYDVECDLWCNAHEPWFTIMWFVRIVCETIYVEFCFVPYVSNAGPCVSPFTPEP